ncbi:MAG: hypothetical protein ACT4OK_00615 [Gemmobacter sp.]
MLLLDREGFAGPEREKGKISLAFISGIGQRKVTSHRKEVGKQPVSWDEAAGTENEPAGMQAGQRAKGLQRTVSTRGSVGDATCHPA